MKALQELGWVERNTSESDNRVTHVTLSAAGREVVARNLPRRSAFLQDVLDKVTADKLEHLSEGLQQLEAGIAEALARVRDAEDVA